MKKSPEYKAAIRHARKRAKVYRDRRAARMVYVGLFGAGRRLEPLPRNARRRAEDRARQLAAA